ncbi:MAG: SPOR domain-containing protein [Acidobacteriota bacterium]
MTTRFPITGRQILWVAAGSLALAFLVAAASWLFSPRPKPVENSGRPVVPEAQVERRPFQPESPPALPPPAAEERPAAAPGTLVPESPAPPAPASPPRAAPPTAPPPSAQPAPAPPPAKGSFAIQLGAFATLANARDLQGRVKALGFGATVVSKGGRHKVLVPGYRDRAAADRALQDLRKAGFSGAFVVPAE